MEMGLVICAQIFVLAAVSIVPMMVLRQNAAQSRSRIVATSQAQSRPRIRR